MKILLLSLLLAAPVADPSVTRRDDGYLTLKLPAGLLDSPEIQRRLISGLTTSIELETQIKGAAKPQMALITIRYLVWDEKVLVQQWEPQGGVHEYDFANLEALTHWLAANPVPIAWLGENRRGELYVRTRCRVVPYSSEEADRTRQWFTQRLATPGASQRGFTGHENDGTGNGVFEVIMSQGINRNAHLSFRWKWRLPRGGP